MFNLFLFLDFLNKSYLETENSKENLEITLIKKKTFPSFNLLNNSYLFDSRVTEN